MPKMQRRYKLNSVYYVEGVSEYYRNLKFVGRLTVNGKKHLVFRPVRKASSYRKTH